MVHVSIRVAISLYLLAFTARLASPRMSKSHHHVTQSIRCTIIYSTSNARESDADRCHVVADANIAARFLLYATSKRCPSNRGGGIQRQRRR